MASFMVTRSILSRLANHKYIPHTNRSGTQPNPTKMKPEHHIQCDKESLSDELLCRACSGSACTPLRETIDNTDIMSALQAVTGISMSLDDRLPKYICTECLMLLRSALNLRQKCADTDRKLRDTIASSGTSSKCYPYSRHNFQMILHKMTVKRAEAREAAERALARRANRHKPKVKKKKTRNQFKCQPCALSFPNKEALTSHRLRRSCMRHPCHICGQLVLSLKQHVRVSHGQGCVHKCDVCGKEFPIVARLRSHRLIHEDKFNFYCDMCPYKSKHKYYLVMHMRTHTGEKPYKCAQCDATFVNPSNLNKHRLTHREKQFQCGLCDKTFRTSTALREHHEAAHMNLKHTCKFCGSDFCYKSDLRKHEIRHHNRVKRDYIGGEPTYKQVERLQRLQESAVREPEGDKWAAPPTEIYPHVYVYPAQEQFVQQQSLETLPISAILDNTIIPDPSMKKQESKQYSEQSVGFYSYTNA